MKRDRKNINHRTQNAYCWVVGTFMGYLLSSFFLFATSTFSIMNMYYLHNKNKVKLLLKI